MEKPIKLYDDGETTIVLHTGSNDALDAHLLLWGEHHEAVEIDLQSEAALRDLLNARHEARQAQDPSAWEPYAEFFERIYAGNYATVSECVRHCLSDDVFVRSVVFSAFDSGVLQFPVSDGYRLTDHGHELYDAWKAAQGE